MFILPHTFKHSFNINTARGGGGQTGSGGLNRRFSVTVLRVIDHMAAKKPSKGLYIDY